MQRLPIGAVDMCFKKIKSFLILTGTMLCFFSTTNSYAQGAIEQLLEAIRVNTYETLSRVNELPNYLQQFGEFMYAWTREDKSDSTSNLQLDFTELGNVLLLSLEPTNVRNTQSALNKDLLGQDATQNNLWYANDLVYSTLVGNPFFAVDPRKDSAGRPAANPQYNYIKNAAGFNIPHIRPGVNWQGSKENQDKYQGLYNTIIAAESFNANALISQYLEGNQFNATQQKLLLKATNPNWMAEVASEDIGIVLRQLLLFQSQLYVLTTQMVQTQKQSLIAQVINNSLTIAGYSQLETLLAANAQGIQPQVSP